jgi:hypothetical protein
VRNSELSDFAVKSCPVDLEKPSRLRPIAPGAPQRLLNGHPFQLFQGYIGEHKTSSLH